MTLRQKFCQFKARYLSTNSLSIRLTELGLYESNNRVNHTIFNNDEAES